MTYVNRKITVQLNKYIYIYIQACPQGFEKGGSGVHNQLGISGIISETLVIKKFFIKGGLFEPPEHPVRTGMIT